MYLKGLKLEVTLHLLHSNCKNLQKKGVNECEYAKNWKIDFADVCIFFFDGSHICRFLPILRTPTVPPPSLGVTLDTLKQMRLY